MILWCAVSPDSVMPLFSIAAGAAVATIYLMRAPVQADFKARFDMLMGHVHDLERTIDQEMTVHATTRRRLGTANRRLAEAGLPTEDERSDGDDDEGSQGVPPGGPGAHGEDRGP